MTDPRDDIARQMEPIARRLLGEPNEALSSEGELRFGNHGSMAINLQTGCWFDHERGVGGGVLALIKDVTGVDGRTWIERNGFEAERAAPRKANGRQRAPLGKIVATYPYRDANGELLFEVLRYSPKNFRQRRPDRNSPGKWIWDVEGVPRVPYRLPELNEQIELGRRVVIVEGEKDADRLWGLGVPATCNAGGAGKWHDDLTAFFVGAHVVVVGDHDPQKRHQKTGDLMFHEDGSAIFAGQDHAQAVARALSGVARVRVLDLSKHWPDIPPKADISDWLALGHSREDLDRLLDQAEDHRQAKVLGEWDAGTDKQYLPPPRGWLLGTAFCRKFISSIVAPGGVGKSALRLAQLISLAIGRPLTGEHVFQRCRVLIVSLEDDADELRRRLRAACLHHGVAQPELEGWLFLASPGADGGKLMVPDQHGRPVVGALAGKLAATIMDRKIDICCIDPFVKSHSVEENSNSMIDKVVQILSDMAGALNCAIDLPHHTAKGQADPGNPDRGRGASSMRDAGRLVYTLTPMTPEEAQALGVSEAERRSLIRLDSAKVNIMPPMTAAKWFRLVGVEIGNETDGYPSGDNVQTVEAWSPPGLFADISVPVLNAILDDIEAGLPDGNRYSDAPNVTDRAAWRVIDRHCGKGEGPARQIIKMWVGSGLLIQHSYENPTTRKPVKGLRVDAVKRPS
ncbi:AAA family ATPase [Bradyrhizobium sp. 6(2017)]|uniref:AAA family ATPase n=2 Tax=unclassified Bradyrhizobium TaxID=2631580 RepID=UPI0013E17CE6|nr:AAA family ATPase [Bradyrhizobium sp. 6(2017)]QIG98585.1 AAA family ATPase [Bradyrhizobium sp. 6(2017)]